MLADQTSLNQTIASAPNERICLVYRFQQKTSPKFYRSTLVGFLHALRFDFCSPRATGKAPTKVETQMELGVYLVQSLYNGCLLNLVLQSCQFDHLPGKATFAPARLPLRLPLLTALSVPYQSLLTVAIIVTKAAGRFTWGAGSARAFTCIVVPFSQSTNQRNC